MSLYALDAAGDADIGLDRRRIVNRHRPVRDRTAVVRRTWRQTSLSEDFPLGLPVVSDSKRASAGHGADLIDQATGVSSVSTSTSVRRLTTRLSCSSGFRGPVASPA